jgi:hypothetical protein
MHLGKVWRYVVWLAIRSSGGFTLQRGSAKILISLCECTFASSMDGILHNFSVGDGHKKKSVDCSTLSLYSDICMFWT